VVQKRKHMKRIFVLGVMILLFTQGTVFAQQKPFQFGIKFAPNISWLKTNTDGYTSNGSGVGFSWGFKADFALTENYFVSTGFNAEWNNASLKYPYKSEALQKEGIMYRDYKLRYLEIPLTLKMKTNRFNDKFTAFGQLGLGSAFKIGAKSKDQFEYVDDDGTTKITPEDEKNISDEINLFKASLIVGGGGEFYIDESTLVFAAINYNNGFTNILNGKNTVDPTLTEKAQLHFIELSFGVIF